jgi:hypothetical protein
MPHTLLLNFPSIFVFASILLHFESYNQQHRQSTYHDIIMRSRLIICALKKQYVLNFLNLYLYSRLGFPASEAHAPYIIIFFPFGCTIFLHHHHHHHHHHHVHEELGVLSCSLILKVKLVPPSLPRSSYVSLSFWSIL